MKLTMQNRLTLVGSPFFLCLMGPLLFLPMLTSSVQGNCRC